MSAPEVVIHPATPDRRDHWDLFLGTQAAFCESGFVEVARRLPRRPILRYEAPAG